MIAKQAFRVLRGYVKLVRPKINKYDNIFQLLKDNSQTLKSIKKLNNQLKSTTKYTTKQEQLERLLSIPKNQIEEITKSVINSVALHPVTNKAYAYSETISSFPKFDMTEEQISNMSHPYQQNSFALKSHYSITAPVPLGLEYEIGENVGYVFGLPSEIQQKDFVEAFGKNNVESVDIRYCMLGLPASAAIKFAKGKKISKKIILKSQEYEVVTEDNKVKLGLDRRQLVIKGIDQYQTPASMLQKLSLYGRVTHLSLPTKIYKQPSLQTLKKSLKNSAKTSKIMVHKKNGTIQSQYYPHFNPQKQTKSLPEQKQLEYQNKLKYHEQINIYEDRYNQIVLKNRGFCIVTFSCQEQLQNFYIQNSKNYHMELKNGREQFQFDQEHKFAILRYIDNCQIQRIGKITKQASKQESQNQNSIFFQSLFMNMVHEKMKKEMYENIRRGPSTNEEGLKKIGELHTTYKEHLRNLKESIGKGHKDNEKGNLYGKSFDQLAEEELYGMRISQRAKKPRYEVNIDQYLQDQKPLFDKIDKKKQKKREDEAAQSLLQEDEGTQVKKGQEVSAAAAAIRKYQISLQQKAKSEAAEQAKKKIAQPVQAPRRKFSTIKPPQKTRPKTYSQILQSHMHYNTHLRNTLNSYLGIFAPEQLSQQFQKKPTNYINPQNLHFLDGSPIITEIEIEQVLQKSIFDVKDFYQNFIKENQIAKSINFNVQEKIMKHVGRDLMGEVLYRVQDVGEVLAEFEGQGDGHGEGVVRELNREAAFGEEFRAVIDKKNSKKYIVKLAKMQTIYPIKAIQKAKSHIKNWQKSQQFCSQKLQIAQKYLQYFQNNQPIPDELAQALNLQKGSIIDSEKLFNEICETIDIDKKDMEKIVNIFQYSPEQIKQDQQRQMLILQARQKRQARKAEDYVRDPADVKVRDRRGKAVLSKFRQI